MPRVTPLEKLKQKRAELTIWLGGRLQTLRALRQARDADMALRHQAIQEAKENCARLHDLQDAQIASANGLLELSEVMEEMAAELRRNGGLDLMKAREMDTSEAGISAAKEFQRELHLAWVDRMRAAQDGQTRRKRGELAKLTRRIEQKETLRAKRLGGGTPTASDIQYGKGLDPSYGTSQPKQGE